MADNVTLKAISPSSGAYEAGTVMATNQQPDGAHAQKVAVVDVHGHIANVQQIAAAMDGDEYGMITNAVIHGKSTAGGGSWVDVKVTPSGAIAADTTISGQEVALDVRQVDNAGNSLIVTGPFTGQNGIRVYGGPTDPISDTPVIMDAAHHHLHEGETHQYTYGPIAQANTSNVDFRFVVPVLTATTRTPHLALELDSTGEEWLLLYESPTTSANGTQQTVVNKNRNSTITPGSTVWLAPTVTAVGTFLSAWIVGSGEKSGSSGRESIEWALKSNTTYLIRISAKNANNVCMRLIWYEDLGV